MGKCRICGKTGHNRLKCPTLKPTFIGRELDLETGEYAECEMFCSGDKIELISDDGNDTKKRTPDDVFKLFNFSTITERSKKKCSECASTFYYAKRCKDTISCADCFYKKKKICDKCGGAIKFINKWKDMVVCSTCYVFERDKLSEAINEYIISKGMTNCAFCKKERTCPYGFHLDHINMFDKETAIIKMIMNGADLEDAIKEVDKCQMLCVDCHMLVSSSELMCKFTRAKARKIDEKELYDKVMPIIYQKIIDYRLAEVAAGGADGDE